MKWVGIISLALALAACSKIAAQNRVAFDGLYFDARLASVKSDPTQFDIAVRKATRNLDAAREAGRYEATAYCVRTYGTSDVVWVNGPDDASLNVQGDDVILKGTCNP